MGKVKIYRYGRCVVKVWRIREQHHPYPWRFSVQEDGKNEVYYGGMPNQCETAHAALMRGWWRAKWTNDGTINMRYK